MADKKLKFSVHIHGKLEKAVESPLGFYHVDVEKELYYFEPKREDKPAEILDTIMAAMACAKGAKNAKVVGGILANFARLKKEQVQKQEDGEYTYDFKVEGELEEFVKTKFGSLYGLHQGELYYFKSAHGGFMRPIELKKFTEGIKNDLNSEDETERTGAELVMEILHDWTELDTEDIIEE